MCSTSLWLRNLVLISVLSRMNGRVEQLREVKAFCLCHGFSPGLWVPDYACVGQCCSSVGCGGSLLPDRRPWCSQVPMQPSGVCGE